jgi:prepilin-type N-terminal cleavage/methylation domain-containing protein
MRRSEKVRAQSGGFTLIELIVVIAIIAILAGLLLQVIVKVRENIPRVQTKHEISQIGVSIEQFKTTYGVPYIPPYLIVSSNYNQYPGSVAMNDSRIYMSKVWAKGVSAGLTNWPLVDSPLDGNQVLVFLLGGMPPNRQGWYDSQTNPFQIPPDGSKAKGPFFEFKTDRIDANGHYLDPYGNPYFYFSARNGGDYDYFGKIYYDIAPDMTPNPDPARAGGLLAGMTRDGGYGSGQLYVQPFRSALDGKYLNPSTYQLISAGRNNIAGRGSPCTQWSAAPPLWSARTCMSYMLFEEGLGDYAPGAAGGDDIANFGSTTILGGGK